MYLWGCFNQPLKLLELTKKSRKSPSENIVIGTTRTQKE